MFYKQKRRIKTLWFHTISLTIKLGVYFIVPRAIGLRFDICNKQTKIYETMNYNYLTLALKTHEI